MYVINGIPEIRKMGTGIPIFDLNGFQVFRFDFPPENSGIPKSEAEFRIPVVPEIGIQKRNSQPRSIGLGYRIFAGFQVVSTQYAMLMTPYHTPISTMI